MKLKYIFEYILVRFFIIVFNLLPGGLARTIASGIGSFSFTILRVRRIICIENLTAAFPEKDKAEIFSIARKSYNHLGLILGELCRLPHLIKNVQKNVRIENLGYIDKALEGGKGLILVGAHFGNWEIIAQALSTQGYKITFINAELRNGLVNTLVNKYRQLAGLKLVARGAASRGIIKALRRNEIVGIIGDQDAGKKGLFVDFMGRKASTPTGPALFSLKIGAPILVYIPLKIKGDNYQIQLHKLSGVARHDDHAKDVYSITQSYTKLFEDVIKQYPDRWMWMHRRWKTRPQDIKDTVAQKYK